MNQTYHEEPWLGGFFPATHHQDAIVHGMQVGP